MDGDSSAKTFEQGANSALKETEMSSGIHESVNQIPSVGDKTNGTGPSVFSKDGPVGSLFQADGAIGGTADQIGGPFAKNGAVGRHFNPYGKIGGMVQKNLADNK